MTSAFRWETFGVAGHKTDVFLFVLNSEPRTLFYRWHSAVSDKTLFIAQCL